MKLFRMLKCSIRDAFKSFYRNISLSIASISCITITLLVVSVALLASFNVKSFSNKIKSEVSMVVFLNIGVTDDEINSFETKLNELDNVAEGWVKKTPSERKEMLLQEDEFWSSVIGVIDDEAEIFHQSYEIKVKDVTKINETVDDLQGMEEVQVVNCGETTISTMVSIFDIVEKIAFGIVIVLVIVSVFLIVNTIKLTIFSRKREISIMRVVGASNWTIKNPFIIEGLIIGLVGSIIPVGITIWGYTSFYNSLDDGHLLTPLLQFLQPNPFIFLISFIIMVIGALVGMFGSARAVRKYLKI